MEYPYENLGDKPCLEYIKQTVAASAMANKDIGRQGADEEDDEKWTLVVTFDEELITGDLAILNGIVVDSLGKVQVRKSREKIMGEILSLVTSEAQLSRLLDALDDYTSMAIALDNLNYDLARMRVQKVMDDGAIEEADRDLIFSTIPTASFE